MTFSYTDKEIEEMGLARALREVIKYFGTELRQLDRGIAETINRDEDIVQKLAQDIKKLEDKIK